MERISAFVGHSFLEKDGEVVRKFLEFFDRVKDMSIGFTWDHAEAAEPRVLSQKISQKMESKNLFIGICTVKEKVIAPEQLKSGIFRKNTLKADKNDFSWKISDWILQEIGFAFGRDMDMMLIVEEGLNNFGGIQGDLEYISFRRNEPEKAFTKILEMLKTLMPKKIRVGSDSVGELPEKHDDKEPSAESPDTILEPSESWKTDDYEFALLNAIYDGNKDKEEEISTKYIQTNFGRPEIEQIRWEATKLYFYQLLGKKDTLEELRKLAKKYPSHSEVSFYLARIYSNYEEYDKAASHLEHSAKNSVDLSKKISRFCEQTIALAKHGSKDRMKVVINQIKELTQDSEEEQIKLLKTMAEISELIHDNESYFVFNECLLDYKPDDNDRRFSLAYKYSEVERNELSYYHYNVLRKQKPTEVVLNNLGVAASNLGLSYKSVEAYKESEKLGGTLAMNNLAHNMIDSGFLTEASDICNRAIKIEGYDKQIGTAISRIKNVKDQENEKEDKILNSTKNTRKFYADFAKAFLKSSLVNVKGIWKGPSCDLEVSITDNKFEAIGTFERDIGILAAALMGSYNIETKSTKTAYVVRFEGEVFGYGIKFEKKTYEKDNPKSLSEATAMNGIMIISDDISEIIVREIGKDTATNTYVLKRQT